MANFTKGPWVKDTRGECLVNPDGKNIIVWGCGLSSATKTDERVANAHLIAAAPDMYEKLKDMSELLTMLDPHTHANIELDCVVYDIEELLKKARGE